MSESTVSDPDFWWVSGLLKALGEVEGMNLDCMVRNLVMAENFIVHGDQTSHAALELRPSDVRWAVLFL